MSFSLYTKFSRLLYTTTKFSQLLSKYNYSLNKLRESTIQCSVKQLPPNMILVDTGLNSIIHCQHELADFAKHQSSKESIISESKMWKCVMKKCFSRNHQKGKLKRKQVWTEPTNIWRSKLMVEVTILNYTEGGFAAALAGHIAFLPRSVRRGGKLEITIFHFSLRIRKNLGGLGEK